MPTQTTILLIGSVLLALLVATFQYFYKAKRNTSDRFLFAFLRFISFLSLLILLINPIITSYKTTSQKPELVVLADQSKSIGFLEQKEHLAAQLKALQNDEVLGEKFAVTYYGFDTQLWDSIALNSGVDTHLYQALQNTHQLHQQSNTHTLLLSDGNPTQGKYYQNYKTPQGQKIHTVVLGDTTTYEDLRISRVNANNYVQLNNSFPVELLVNYEGQKKVQPQLRVYKGNNLVAQKSLGFSPEHSAEFVTFDLKAQETGWHTYRLVVDALANEKNTKNNQRDFVIETIDQPTRVLLVSDKVHPDISALKRSIETNRNCIVEVKKPSAVSEVDAYQLLVYYQPNESFADVFKKADATNLSSITVTGLHTDWAFLNSLNRGYQKEVATQIQEVQPALNTNFALFQTDLLDVTDYPPLQMQFGEITWQQDAEVLLQQQIGVIPTQAPLLGLLLGDRKEAVLFGEGLWQWRMKNYKTHQRFEQFDLLTGKLVRLLATQADKKRLVVSHTYEQAKENTFELTAYYYNKSYEFDPNAQLSLAISKAGKIIKTMPLNAGERYYTISVNDLEVGTYAFEVKVAGTQFSYKNRFKILNQDQEQRHHNPNVAAMRQLAEQNNGQLWINPSPATLVGELTKIDSKPVIISEKQESALIEKKYLLALLLLTLAIEWFLRKYKGYV